MNKFGIGQPAPQPEDPRFVTGRGRFDRTGGLRLANPAWGCRSQQGRDLKKLPGLRERNPGILLPACVRNFNDAQGRRTYSAGVAARAGSSGSASCGAVRSSALAGTRLSPNRKTAKIT